MGRTSLVLGSPRQPWAVLEPETPGILPPNPQQGALLVNCAPHWGLQAPQSWDDRIIQAGKGSKIIKSNFWLSITTATKPWH